MATLVICVVFFGFAGMVLTWSIYEGFNKPSWMVKAKNYSNAKALQVCQYVKQLTINILHKCKHLSIFIYHKMVLWMKMIAKACLSWTAKTCKKLDKKIKTPAKAKAKASQ